MLSSITKKILSLYPVPTELVNDMRDNPPIFTIDPRTITGRWTEKVVIATIMENLTILRTRNVPLYILMRNAQHSLALYMEMSHHSNVCTDKQLVDAIVAQTFQLVTNLMTAGPRLRVVDGETDGSYIIVIDIERYDPDDEDM